MNTLTSKSDIKRILLTPEMATELLNHNGLNRPVSDPHVRRLVDQIKRGLWQFNGDTIKVSDAGEILDGQHRCWACVEAAMPIETIVVKGIPRAAFATVDTLRKPRGAADILSLNGVTAHRREAAVALTWLVRWQRKPPTLASGSGQRVENSEIEAAYAHHPNIVQAAQVATPCVRGFVSPGLIAFIYYIFSNRDHDLAERFIKTLESPAGLPISDPFFKFRQYLVSGNKERKKTAQVVIAMAIKAANAAHAGKKIESLMWKNSGAKPEIFPKIAF